MYQGKRIGVVVPAYNEEGFIAAVINTIPDFVDRIYVIDDASTDKTRQIASETARQNGRATVLSHGKNRGVGAAIVTGYKEALADNVDIVAVMAGDNQMDPARLSGLLSPLTEGGTDYAKGNRMNGLTHLKGMTCWRRSGNWLLRWLTRIASGNYSLTDPQNGYTAITRRALEEIDLDRVYSWYGYCNDMLVKLSACGARVLEVPIPARYGAEKSKIVYRKYIPRVSLLLLRGFLWRLRAKYLYGQGLNLDFTLGKYRQLLEAICGYNYTTYTVAGYLDSSDPEKAIILRHDVDRKPEKALKMARLEQKFGIRATYYFRFNRATFQPHVIRQIAGMGHEAGYHYETLDKAKGDFSKAIKIFGHELAEFRKITEVKTVCMHGNPLTEWDNRQLWEKYDHKDFGLTGEAYLSMGNIAYLSDTGRTWDGKHKVKDHLPDDRQSNKMLTAASTNDIIELLKKGQLDRACLLVHPERWSGNIFDWTGQLLLDTAVNLAKRLLRLRKA